MKTLMAKIKKNSVHYKKGINQKGKSIWLSVTEFNINGAHNFKIKAIKGIKNGFAEWENIWVSIDEITLKQHEDNQLTLNIFSNQELEENKYNPRYFNQRRFEVTTKNEKQYFLAPNHETVNKIAKRYGLSNFKISQVPRLSNKEINEA